MRILLLVACGLFSVGSALAETRLGAAIQAGDPVHFSMTKHSLQDALESASLESRTDKTIVSYRVGGVSVEEGKTSLHEGMWIALPTGAGPGTVTEVPAQGIPLNVNARLFLFYVAELRYADGGSWSADAEQIIAEAKSR